MWRGEGKNSSGKMPQESSGKEKVCKEERYAETIVVMEMEKLTLMNDNLRIKLEASKRKIRELEQDSKAFEQEIKVLNDKLKQAQENNMQKDSRWQDLKLQVREEAIKNTKLEERIEALCKVEEELGLVTEQLAHCQKEIQHKQNQIEKAKHLEEELKQIKELYEKCTDSEVQLKEQVNLLSAENKTLKLLLAAKGSVLISKSNTLDALKAYLCKKTGRNLPAEEMERVLEQAAASNQCSINRSITVHSPTPSTHLSYRTSSFPSLLSYCLDDSDPYLSSEVKVKPEDHVLVDISSNMTGTQRRTQVHPAQVKYVGLIASRDSDKPRLYVGVRLEQPVGDSDGTFRGHRYFKVTQKHAKFVRISKVKGILNSKSHQYEDLHKASNPPRPRSTFS